MLNAFKSPQNVALIGAGSEIGLEVVKHLKQENLQKVILASRDGGQSYKDLGIALKSDFATDFGRSVLIEKIFSHGDIDVAILAIGILYGSLEEITLINYLASIDLISQIANRMKKQGHGSILVISSFAQTRPRVDNYLYGSSKAGLDFFARGISEDFRGTGVKISILRPGFVHTKMTAGLTPAPFAITAEEAGRIGAMAISKSKKIVFTPRILTIISKILQVVPNFIFRKLQESR